MANTVAQIAKERLLFLTGTAKERCQYLLEHKPKYIQQIKCFPYGIRTGYQ